MRFMLGATTLVALTIALSSGCSSSSPGLKDKLRGGTSTNRVAQAIEGGNADSTHKYAMGVCIGSPNNCGGICSGALILPNVVATARHCVDQATDPIKCKENPSFGPRVSPTFSVTTRDSLLGGSGTTNWYNVKSVAVPTDDHICGNDIALLILQNPVPAAQATPITPGIQYVMWDPAPEYVPIFTAIGYGKQGPEGQSGTRMKKELIRVYCMWDSPDDNCAQVLDSAENPDAKYMVNAKEFLGGDGMCQGDSGSSAYEQTTFDKGTPVSFGVLSRGPADACSISIYTRFDQHRDFVLDVVKQASENWTLYPEPSWTSPKPKPSPTKDAGTSSSTSSSGSSEEPEKKGLGATCKDDDGCSSNACVDPGDGVKICSKPCDPGNEFGCPSGYLCTDGFCLPGEAPTAPAAAAPQTVTTTEGCSAASPTSPVSPYGWLAGVSLAIGLAVSRRRKPDN